MGNAMSVTQHQIAKELGVSQRTVSVAFAGGGRINPETRDRILAAAAALGYRPNAAARAIRKGRFNAIGLLSSIRINEAAIHPLAMWAVQQEMARREMHLVMSPIPDLKLLESGGTPQILRQWSVDGILVSYTYNAPQPLVGVLEHHRVPAVWVNTRLSHDCIHLDDHGAGRACAQRLIDAGHRRIAYVSFRERNSHYSAADREQGYRDALAAAGLTPQVFVPPPGRQRDHSHLPQVTDWLRDTDQRPTAVVTYEENEAAMLLLAAARLGVAVPDELSLCAVRSSSVPVVGVHLSGMELRHFTMGERSVQLLAQKIDQPLRRLAPVVVRPETVEGATVAPPR